MGFIKLPLKHLWMLFLFFIAVNSLALWSYWDELQSIIEKRMEHLNWSIPTTIFSRPFLLYAGQDIDAVDFFQRIRRLGYRPVDRTPTNPGQYLYKDGILKITTQPALMPDGDRASEKLRITIHPRTHRIDEIVRESNSEKLSNYELEPEILSYLFADKIEKRQIVSLDQVSPLFWNTVILIEDTRFRDHTGIDIKGLLRAVYYDIRAGNLSQGGSTLTQQLVKNFFLNRQRKIARKINEALMSILLERSYSKERILEAYINEIYFGQDGAYPIHGIQEASLFYFSKQAHDLDPADAALLVALIRGPNVYSPFQNPDNALQRRNFILSKMLEKELISEHEYKSALETPIPREARSRYQKRIAPYFVDHVVSELISLLETHSISGEGLNVFTTLDPLLQTRSNEGFSQGLESIKAPVPLEGAFVLTDHRSGDVLALSGGHDYGATQFNRATQAKRQIGSLFKPVVYLQALIQTLEGTSKYNWNTLVDDTPFSWNYDDQIWEPKNYDEMSHPHVTFTEALVNSYNIATARLSWELGLKPIIELGIKLGFSGPIPVVPSIILGSTTSTMMEVANVFGAIANGCFQYAPHSVLTVFNQSHELLWRHDPTPNSVAPTAACAYLSLMLKETFQSGTARTLRNKVWSKDFGGKTGTTSGWKDAWFVGSDAQWTLVTWVGNDQQQTTTLSGATGALPIWAAMMDRIQGLRPLTPELPLPPEILRGGIPGVDGSCKHPRLTYYFEGNPPSDLCR